jgi:excisionase family DNA binding protein
MNNQITVEEVSNQFAKAIKLLLEWAQQEFQSRKNLPDKDLLDFQTPLESEKLLKAVEVAKILQVSSSKVYRMMMLDEIPSIRLGKAVRIQRSALDALIKKSN